MADLNARIKPKKSSTTGEVPQAADLEVAEIAVNTADGKLFVKHTDNSIKEISGTGGGATAIDDLTDVDTSTVAPTDGQILTWVDANSQWEPAPLFATNTGFSESSGDLTAYPLAGIDGWYADQAALEADGFTFITGSANADDAALSFTPDAKFDGIDYLNNGVITSGQWFLNTNGGVGVDMSGNTTSDRSGNSLTAAASIDLYVSWVNQDTKCRRAGFKEHTAEGKTWLVVRMDAHAPSYNSSDGLALEAWFATDGSISVRYGTPFGTGTFTAGANRNVIVSNGVAIGQNPFPSLSSSGAYTYNHAYAESIATGLNLDDLEDVSAGGPSDGQVLTWSDTDSKWKPAIATVQSTSLDALTDTNIDDVIPLNDNNILYYSSLEGKWFNRAVQNFINIDDLTDVKTSSPNTPTDGQALVWNNTDSRWEPGAAGATEISDLTDVTTNVPGDPDFASVSLLAQGAAYTDSSSNSLTLTNNGASLETTTTKWGGGSYNVTTDGSNILVNHDAALDLSTGDWTIEMWVKGTSNPMNTSTVRYLIALGESDFTAPGFSWTIGLDDEGFNLFWAKSGGASANVERSGWFGFSTVSWKHLAVTRSGNTIRFYYDGSQIGSDKDISANPTAVVQNTPTTLGGRRSSGGYLASSNFPGYIEDVRITKGVARYTGSSYTKPTEAFLTTAATSPTDGQVLTWVDANSQWEPADAAGGGGGGAVDSVNGQTGIVSLGVLDLDDTIDEGDAGTATWTGRWMVNRTDVGYCPDPGDVSRGTNGINVYITDEDGQSLNSQLQALNGNDIYYSINGGPWLTEPCTNSFLSCVNTAVLLDCSDILAGVQIGDEVRLSDGTQSTLVTPADGQVLTWVDANSQWEPVTPSVHVDAVSSVNDQTGVVSLGIFDLNDTVDPGLPASSTWTGRWIADRDVQGYCMNSGEAGRGGDGGTAAPDGVNVHVTDEDGQSLYAELQAITDTLWYSINGGPWAEANVTNATISCSGATAIFTTTELYDAWNANYNIGDELRLSDGNPVSTLVVPTDGQVLTWVDANSQWEPADAAGGGGGATAIDDLTDVDTSTAAPTDGQVLTWVDANSQWEPVTPPVAGTVTSIDVAGGTGLTSSGGPITTSGSITVNLDNTTVTPGSYTSADITVDAQGRITAASNGSGGVASVNGQQGAVVLNLEDINNVSDGGDYAASDTVLLMKFDGSDGSTAFTDSSYSNVQAGSFEGYTATLNAQLSTSDKVFGSSSLRLDNGFITMRGDQMQALNFGTADFTAELWFKDDVGGTTLFPLLVRQGNNTGNVSFDLFLTSGNFHFRYMITGTGTVYDYTVPFTPAAATWYHLAVVRQGDQLRQYVDGSLVATHSGVPTDPLWNIAPQQTDLCIGAWKTPQPGSANIVGNIDDVRLTNFARYSTSFAPIEAPIPGTKSNDQILKWVDARSMWEPSDNTLSGLTDVYTLAIDQYRDDVVLLLRGDGVNGGTVINNEGVANLGTPTLTNLVTSTTESKFEGSSLRGDFGYIEYATNTAFHLSAQDFTFECWVRIDDTVQNDVGFIDIGGNENSFQMYYSAGNLDRSIRVLYSTNGSSWSYQDFDIGQVASNAWYHLAVCRIGNVIRTFWNGVKVGSDFAISGVIWQTSGPTYIGANNNGGVVSKQLKGYLDEVRLTVGTARYFGDFSIPTSAYPDAQISQAAEDGQVLAFNSANNRWEPTNAISKATLQAEVAASTDFADFQARIAAL